MASQKEDIDSDSPELPASPESQKQGSDTDSLPDIVNTECTTVEEVDEIKTYDSPTPPPKKKMKLKRVKISAHAEVVPLPCKMSTPCPCAMVLGTAGNTGKRHLALNTKERCRVQILKIRIHRAFWDSQIEGYKCTYEMKAGKKCREDDGPADIPKFRRFLRAFEKKWVCWGVQWLDSANQTLSREDSRPDIRACLSHIFPNAPEYLYATFRFYCDYFIGATVAYHSHYVTDLQSHILTFCPGVYYIVHYCMSLGIPSFMIVLYLLDVFLGKDCYVTMQELEFTIDMITKTDMLPNYCDWCFNSQLMIGHFVEPMEAYSVVFRIVDVISLGLGMDNNCELLQYQSVICVNIIVMSNHHHNAVVIPRGIRKTVQAKLEYPTLPKMNKNCTPSFERLCTPWVTCTMCTSSNTIQACFQNLDLRHHMNGGGVKVTKYTGTNGKTGGVLMTASELFIKQQYHQFLGDDVKIANMDNSDM